MNCPGLDHCEMQEHKGYRNCADASGQCQNQPMCDDCGQRLASGFADSPHGPIFRCEQCAEAAWDRVQ